MLLAFLNGAERVDTVFANELLPGSPYCRRLAKGTSWSQDAETIEPATVCAKAIESVGYPFDVWGKVAGDLGWSEVGGFPAIVFYHFEVWLRISRHYDRAKNPTLRRRRNCVGDQRVAGQHLDILVSQSLGACTGRD